MARLICLVALTCWLTAFAASPAEAGPLVAAISGIATSLGFSAAASSAIAGWLVKTAISVGLSRLAMAMKGRQRQPGITTETTTAGGTTPQKFIMGLHATGGQLVAPINSYGAVGKTPRAYLVYPIALSVVAGCTLERIIINDAYVSLSGTSGAWGRAATGELADVAMVDYRDGSQTAVHADLLAAFSADPDRPWQSDMVGPGTCYAVTRFSYNRELFNGLPAVRFEVLGIPLYDPRADSSVGGSGAQRWANPATWAQSLNPMVMIYNILRGIDVGGGMIWGGECEAEDLPLAEWFAAMNECDQAVAKSGGGTEPQYRAGIEIALEEEPASVIEELLKTCMGQLVEVGGIWKPRAGGPAMPSFFLTDDDILISQDQEYTPFPSYTETFNGIECTYVEPNSLWEPKDAPPRYSATWEAEDGGRRLVAALSLRACSSRGQAQRLMKALIADHRRMRRNQFGTGPEGALLEPLETIGWNSATFGYVDWKVFEITSMTDHLMTLNQSVAVRERDSGDVAWEVGNYEPTDLPSPSISPMAPQVVQGWSVTAETVKDAAGNPRANGVRMHWSPDGAEDARGLRWQARIVGQTAVQLSGTYADVDAGTKHISAGLMRAHNYEWRSRYIVDRPSEWTAWTPVTTDDVGFSFADMSQPFIEAFDDAVATGDAALAGHNALVAGFTGTLVDGFNAVNNDVLALEAEQTSLNADIGGLNTNVTRILGCRADLLTGTALAALFTQLSVSTATGLSAWATSQAAAVATLAGKVSASYVFRVGAGGAAAGLEMVAQDSAAGGAVSTFKINADFIYLVGKVRASSMLISDSSNLFRDFDMLDEDLYYTDTSAVYSFLGASSARLGQRYVSIAAAADYEAVYTKWFDVQGDTEYKIDGASWLSATGAGVGTAALYFQTGEMDGAGTVTMIAQTLLRSVANTGYAWSTSHSEVSHVTPIDCRKMRFLMYRPAGGSGSARFGGLAVRRKVDSVLIKDGAVTAAKLNTDDLNVAGVSIFGGELKSSNYAESGGIPSAGWKLTHAGVFKGKSVVLRDALADGAASDKDTSFFTTAVNIPDTVGYVYLIHTVGPVAAKSIFKRGVSFEARHVSPGGYATDIYFQVRRKYDGVWGAWETLKTWSYGATESFADWRMHADSGTLAGVYDNVQYRLMSERNPSGLPISGIRNAYITTINLVK